MDGDKKIAVEPLRGLGGCVEAETGEVIPQTKPAIFCDPKSEDQYSKCIPIRNYICKVSEKGFELSDGRKITFSQSSVTHLSEKDWNMWKLNSTPYAEGNYLMRSANLYAFMGPEFEKSNEMECNFESLKLDLDDEIFKNLALANDIFGDISRLENHLTLPSYTTKFTAQEIRDYLDLYGIGYTTLQEQAVQQILLATGTKGRASYYYGADGEFENLSVAVQGNVFADFLENYIEKTDDLSLAGLQSLLWNVGEIEITYTEGDDGERGQYAIAADREIPPEIEDALRSLAHEYVYGFFADSLTNSSEE